MKIPLQWLSDYVKTDKSPRELAASFTQLGLMLDKPLDESSVLDLEHRMDRADWLSILGCARDLAAFEKIKLHYPASNTTKLPRISAGELVEIKVETPLVRRFFTRVVKGVKVAPSPSWLKDRLESYGIRSINNVVDITNFCMVEYGQTMHAQDLAKMKKREIIIRQAKKGEHVVTLLGTTVNLDPDVFILTSGGVPTVIGGIVGGLDTSVTESTQNIILDAGNYNQSAVRKTSRRLKIINESVSRNDKFLDPRLCEIAVERATYLLQEICGGKVYENVDYYPQPIKPASRTLSYARLATISGLNLPTSVVKSILTSLEYTITKEDKLGLTVTIPYFRTDVEVEDDLIADILRIYNYANIPVSPLTTAVPANITPPILNFEDKLRDLLIAQGAHEHITTPLIQADNTPNQVILSNALSSDQNALRTSMIPKLEEIILNYRKHKIEEAIVFEIGKTFTNDSGKYYEHRSLSVVSTVDLRDTLTTLLTSLGISYQINNSLQILANQTILGSLTLHSFTLNTEVLLDLADQYPPITSDFAHRTSRDLSLLVPSTLTYADITTALEKSTFTYQSISCKSHTQLGALNNYLLTLTWDQNKKADAEVKQILKLLKTKLNIDSKS